VHKEKHKGHEGFREHTFNVLQVVKLYFYNNRKQENF